MTNRSAGITILFTGIALALVAAGGTWWVLFDRVFTDEWMAEFGILLAVLLAGGASIMNFAFVMLGTELAIYPFLSPAARRAIDRENERERRRLLLR